MKWLEVVFKRVVVVFVRLQKDETMKVDVVRTIRDKHGTRVESAVTDMEPEELGGMKLKDPVLAVVSGHGVIRKVFQAEDADGMERVTGNEELIYSRSGEEKGEVTLCFTRRERIVSLEEMISRERMPVLEMRVACGDGKTTDDAALLLAGRFYGNKVGWRELVHGGTRGDRLAGLVADKIKIVMLCSLLVLLLVNYLWNGSVRERYAGQQIEMSSLERDVSNREKLSREMENVVREFKGNGVKRYCAILDRIAAVVPPKVNLETLTVNPLLKTIEERKSLVLREGYVELTGETPVSGEVTVFTGALAECDFARQVKLLSLDKDRETGMFHFKILIDL